MANFNIFKTFFGGINATGSDNSDLIIGSFGDDTIAGNGGSDLIAGLFGDDTLSGGADNDTILGGFGDDKVIGNKGDDRMFGGRGNDQLIWNNGDGSDLMDGGSGQDRVQVNFNTDLVNDDLQNDDVAEFSVTDTGVQFARTELNGQTEAGLFQLDIRNTETLETNFGGGADAAAIVGAVLDEIELALDGGDGIDTLNLSQAAAAAPVDLSKGTLGTSSVENFENVIGSEFDDFIVGDAQDNVISGLGGVDQIYGGLGNDTLIANKGNDFVYGGAGDDALVWNNGDGSDLLDGGADTDLVQVNFDTDLVNDDLQNKDVAEFSVTETGVQFARIEVNDQTEAGLFQLDIRNTETLETNFGDGADAAVIVDDVLDTIELALDGGDGVDLLDLSQAADSVTVDLDTGLLTTLDVFTVDTNSEGVLTGNGEGVLTTEPAQGTPIDVSELFTFVPPSSAINFENITGSAFDDTLSGNDLDNVIRGGSGNDTMEGGAGADTFVFFEQDVGVDVILDFEFGVDTLQFLTTNPDITTENVLANLTQVGADVELEINARMITFENTELTDFGAGDFLIG